MVIDPTECIDCAVCVPECPADAIYADQDVPADQQQFAEINAELAKLWPVISRKTEPLPDADSWKGRPDKIDLLDRGG